MKKTTKNKTVRKTVQQMQNQVDQPARHKTIVNKIVLGALALAFVILCLWGIRTCGNYTYGRNVKEFKANASLAAKVAATMLNDMIAQWSKMETDATVANPKGLLSKCSDPDLAMQWRRQAFQENGSLEAFEQLMKQIDNVAEDVNNAPSAFKTDAQMLASAHEALDSLQFIINQPGKDLLAFAEKAERIASSVYDALEKTDFHFFVPIEESKVYVDRIATLFKNGNMADVLLNQDVRVDSHLIHALKYKKMGFQPLPDGKGVLYRVITEGNGPVASADSQVKLHYEGKLMSGKVFDSSYARGNPVTMQPNQTVKGFNKALTTMPVGSKWEVFIPANQGYGNRGTGEIQPDSDLFFTIEVLEIL